MHLLCLTICSARVWPAYPLPTVSCIFLKKWGGGARKNALALPYNLFGKSLACFALLLFQLFHARHQDLRCLVSDVHACVYVCVYVCIYVCICDIYIYVVMCVYICIGQPICMYVCVCKSTCVSVIECMYLCSCMHACMHVCVCVCVCIPGLGRIHPGQHARE
jgi:hypothetical protein